MTMNLVHLSHPQAVATRVLATMLMLTVPIAEATASAAQTQHTFSLTNDTSVDMLEFYASPQAATDWEGNILGDNTIQANGDRTVITLPGNRGCLYDFLAVFADGDKLEKFGINVCELETHTYYEN
ncbi:MAG: hypothetical protein AAGI45_12340 [Cyanobacteria bacterium P01_H01_bin.26]